MRMPIDDVLIELRDTLRTTTNAVLTAPPGAGKTTKVPLALLDEPWLQGRRIVMLEPRRIAARNAARRMAQLLGEPVGERVGYRTKGDAKGSARTKIEVVTEGILTRWLQSDPGLEAIGIVIFDEFHERSLHADAGLALCLQAQELFRSDLRILVMSATLDAGQVSNLLGAAPVIRSSGRSFPVETHYTAQRDDRSLEQRAADAVRHALQAHREGDVLVFLPGAAEIHRTAERLAGQGLADHVRIAPLYGALPAEQQDEAIRPGKPGERKVVLATNIAETSLTVEGIRIVIDTGFSRVPRFSPRTGLTHLETVRITASSADQRRGRSGRLGPGVCYRLWTEEEHRQLEPFDTPEILCSDLAQLALDLAIWGTPDPADLKWINAPPQAAFNQAMELLEQLGAVDGSRSVTAHGRRMAKLSMHPRLANMVVRALPLGLGGLACELSVLLEERISHPALDLRDRVDALRHQRFPGADKLRREAVRRYREASGGLPWPDNEIDRCGELIAFAFPDRLAMRRPNGTYVLANGRGAELPGEGPLQREAMLAAAELDGAGANSRIRSAAPVRQERVRELFAENLETIEQVAWDAKAQTVRAVRIIKLGALTLEEKKLDAPDPEQVKRALLQGIRETGLNAFRWTKSSIQWRQRVRFLRAHFGEEWPDVSDEALLDTLEHWLAPYIDGVESFSDLARISVDEALQSLLTWEQRRIMDEWAPVRIKVPSGSNIPVDYSDPYQPVLAVKLQEVFGWQETPRIAGGRAALTLHLLSPAGRAVQVTKDLANFWRETYFEVKKDLKGRYPKHDWPDDPTSAAAARGVKPRAGKP
jgi:ATP-dependent helicase HrpB